MKKALLIGINYINQDGLQLNGCIEDIKHIRNVLIDSYGYKTGDIVMLRDDLDDVNIPTYENVTYQLNELVSNSSACEEIWIHYSGHGRIMFDPNDHTKYQDVILPLDFDSAGYIASLDLFNIIKNSKCKTFLMFDCCNSGSICELQWSFVNTDGMCMKMMTPNRDITNPNIFMLGGAKDNQKVNDSPVSKSNESIGEFTNAFLECLRDSDHNIGLFALYEKICNYLISHGNVTQNPVLSSSSEIPVYTFERKQVVVNTQLQPAERALPRNGTTEYNKITQALPYNMKNIMINKAHRDPNKYFPKR